MAAARVQYVDQTRTEWMSDQLARWRNARDLREFVAVTRKVGNLNEAELSWLESVTDRADKIDPSIQLAAPPDPPEPTPEDLRPFMKGFNPYGPSQW